jgi:penicillin-binding protein 2
VVLALVTASAFVSLLGQLWYLQVVEGERLRGLSERNRIRVRAVPAPRGILYDRHGAPLLENRPAFTLSVIPRDLENRDAVLAKLSALTGIPQEELGERLEGVPADSPWPVRIRRNLAIEEVVRLEEWKLALPGVMVEVEPQRLYQDGRFASHLLGYVREATEHQLKERRRRPGDLVGQSGLERLLDDSLRGRAGGEQIEVDAQGRRVQVLRRQEPTPGTDVITTLDKRVQEVAERVMAGKTGAVVVLDPRSGDLLALVSAPGYNLESFSGPLDRESWLRLIRDPTYPLLNRVFQSEYAPGSLFKLVVAAAALQEGVFTPFDRLPCPESFQIGRTSFRNWKEGNQGPMALYEALIHSCNTFFYQLGLKVGIERMARYATAFGFGTPTGIDFPGERPGLVPTPESKRRASGAGWFPGDTANTAIGQGPLLATPLQVARFMAALASDGILWKPRLVNRVQDQGGRILRQEPPRIAGRVELSPVVFQFLRQALSGVVNDGGTGQGARLTGVSVGGKTATSQNSPGRNRRGRDHAWFAALAPVEAPEVVVVVLVEHGGMGGQVAAPLAGQILRALGLEKSAALRDSAARGGRS